MVAYTDIPEELRQGPDVKPGDRRAFFIAARRQDYKWYGTPKAYTAYPCTVVSVDPLLAWFDTAIPATPTLRDLNPVDHVETVLTQRNTLPASTDLRIPAVGCLWSEWEAWLDAKQRGQDDLAVRRLLTDAEDVMESHGLVPKGLPTVEVDAAALLLLGWRADNWLGHDCAAVMDELEDLRANACRAEEILTEAEEEAAAIRQAQRDGLRGVA